VPLGAHDDEPAGRFRLALQLGDFRVRQVRPLDLLAERREPGADSADLAAPPTGPDREP